MISEEIKKIVSQGKTDTSGKWMQIADVEQVVLTVLNECVKVVEDTPTSCAFTTHDLGAVNCTISKSAEEIRKRFDIKRIYRTKQ